MNYSKHTKTIAFAIGEDHISRSCVARESDGQFHVSDFNDEQADRTSGEQQMWLMDSRNSAKRHICSLCLNPGEYQLIPLDAPSVLEQELTDALRWEVSDSVDVPFDDYVVDYFDVPNANNMGEKRHINVVVVEKKLVIEKKELFTNAGLKLKVIDIPEIALRNLISSYKLDVEGVVFLYLTTTGGLIVFVRDRQIYFSRNLDVGTDQLLNKAEAQQAVALELQRSMDYFSRHYSSVGIKRLVVAPTYPSIPGFVDFLDSVLAISCVEFDYKMDLNWSQNRAKSNSHPLGVLSLGAALRIESRT